MILDYFFVSQNTCPICKEKPRKNSGFCQTCYSKLDLVNYSEYDSDLSMQLTYPLFYNKFSSDILARFKFRGESHLYKSLAQLMYDCGNKNGIFDRVDLIVPVPLHWSSYNKRGFNQSKLLAQSIGKLSGIKINDKLIKKTRPTKAQHNLNKLDRSKNLKDTIRVKEELYDYKVLLVDDVFTTGSTIKSITDSFKNAPIHIETLVLVSGQRIYF